MSQTISSLDEEINFQKVLLLSLKDSTEDPSSRKAEIEAQIAKLVEEKRHLSKIQASSSSSPSTSHHQSNAGSSGLNLSKMDNIFGRGRNSGYQFKEVDSMESLSSTASTPASGASMAEFSGSTRVDRPTRKRTHSNHLDSFVPFEEIKSRRTTPSPFATGATTPSGSSGDDEISFDPSYAKLHKQAEKRLQLERQDAEYARSIANSHGFISSTPANSSEPSAFNKMLAVRPQASSSRDNQAASTNPYGAHASSHTRSLPWVKHTANSNPAVKAERGTSSLAQSSNFDFDGTTGTHWKGSSTAMDSNFISTPHVPGAYVEDPSTASDSDVEIIDSSAFRDNGRQKPTASKVANARPFYSPETRALGETAAARTNTSLQDSLYGINHILSGWTNNSANEMSNTGRLGGENGGAPTLATGSANRMDNTSRLGGQNSDLPTWARSTTYSPSNQMSTAQQGFSINSTSSANSVYSPDNTRIHGFRRSTSTMALQGQSYPPPGPYGESKHSAYQITSMHDAGRGYTVNNIPSFEMLTTFSSSLQQGAVGSMDTFTDFEPDFDPYSSPSQFTSEMRDRMDHVMNDPRKTEKEIKDLLENIKADIEIPLEDREGTPEGLKYPLYEHQKIALTWLKQMEEGTNKGGILADDMGLGKTISTLALLLARPSADRSCKTTLLAAPVALLRQWQSEVNTKVLTNYRPSVYMAHGNSKRATWDDLRQYDVVLTTYGTLGAEYTRLLKFEEDCKEKGIVDPDAKQMARDFPFLGPKSRFYRVVLDEAQCIKNKSTKAASAACRLRALTRFCLTGTPMMNGITELYSLIKFLRIRPYNSWPAFVKDFGCLSKGSRHSDEHISNTMKRLQGVLKAILLRRTKKSQVDGKPIINLPPKVEEIAHVVFSNDEQDYYQSLENKTQLQFNKYKKAGTVGKNYSNILVLLLRLRQCCCHPHLIIDFEAEAPPAGSAELTEEQMIELAKTLKPDVVSRLLGAEGFECNICYDVTPNPSIIIPCGHDNCHDCLSSLSDNATRVAQGNDEGGATIKCPSCRGKLDMTKLIDYRIFKKAHMPPSELEEENEIEDSSGVSDDDTDSDSETDSDYDDVDESGNLNGFIVPDDIADHEAEQGDDEIDHLDMEAPKSKSKSKTKTKTKAKEKRKKGKGKQVEKHKQHLSIAMMKKEASRSIAGHKKYMRYLRKNWQSSAKVDKCVALLEKFQAEGEKTIIFSQFVTFLDLLQVPIGEKGWQCERYDGSINSKRRNEAIQRFTTKDDCKIMLISLKAGNAGLNLVAASRVIILDPFWNPFIEMQAVDRAYRIGQQKPVQVHRILVKETVEDRIMELQERKRALVESALDEGAMKSVGRLDERQLAFLFGVA
ncbi:hypothetical protein DSL72_009235 [Monilinia vaccinii-corymbosi]|uniref:Uncharacterized protein n=1 Tax=Monilinia vaccinii-corymbosi TaxID=61207 RepID=A0A8A3PQL0_9HELO|nr:hypothetical protein DSL72_009235 [Monilinia vaccinii-corymbosi]